MGCWQLPFDKKAAESFKKVMKEPLVPSIAAELMYSIYGDDQLFDDLDNMKNRKGDSRRIIAKHMLLVIKDFEKNPENYKHLLPDNVKKSILNTLNKYKSKK